LRAQSSGRALLPHRIEGRKVIVGPVLTPGGAGCLRCFERRRREALGRSTHDIFVPLAATGSPTAVSTALLRAAVAELSGTPQAHRVFVADTVSGSSAWHTYMPYSDCPDCGTAKTGRTLRPRDDRRSLAPGRLRAQESRLSRAKLARHLRDFRVGVIPHLYRDERLPLAFSVAEVPLRLHERREAGYGRCLTYEEADRVAMFEALERRAAADPDGSHTFLSASYDDVADRAVDPVSLGVPAIWSHDAAALEHFRHGVREWAAGWSLTRGREILVPADVAFYLRPAPRGLGYSETSNGCATGATLEEAAVHGILELVERDAFLLTWYAQLPAPAIDPGELQDELLDLLILEMERRGYAVRFFDITTDTGVPAVWVLAEREDGAFPATFCSAGAHPVRAKAAVGALVEITVNAALRESDPAAEADRARLLWEEPGLVNGLEDHVRRYLGPQARLAFAFLRGDAPAHQRPRFAADWDPVSPHRALQQLTAHLAGLGLETVLVDQTTDEHRALGLASVKIVAPGITPMTFGARLARVHGLGRLRQAQERRGWWAAHQSPPATAIIPHPFP
jgi:ribosomal protein S12 methylthiotransferase accessory factor